MTTVPMTDLMDLTGRTVEMLSSALEAAKEGQSYLLRRQDATQEAPRDPFGVYQKGALDAVESVQRVFRLYEGTAQAMTRAAERLQTSADHTGQEIQATVTQLTGKMKSLYAPLA